MIRCSSRRSGDVVGLYLNPPERAVVLCVDEKSGIQALNRSAPLLPMMPGVAERRSFDYARAYEPLILCPPCRPRRGHRLGDPLNPTATLLWGVQEIPQPDRPNCASRLRRPPDLRQPRHPQDPCDRRLAGRPPPVPSALHPDQLIVAEPGLERWFGLLTDRQLRRGVHDNVTTLERDIRSWIEHWNADPKPFVWTKDRRRNPRTTGPISTTNSWRGTLV